MLGEEIGFKDGGGGGGGGGGQENEDGELNSRRCSVNNRYGPWAMRWIRYN